MRTAIGSALLLAIAAASCSTTGPKSQFTTVGANTVNARFSASPSTVRVTNTTGTELAVRGYADFRPPLPQPLGGMLHLGSVGSGASACIAIPDTVFIFGTNVTTGQRDTIVWTAAHALALAGLDTATITERGRTSPFIPSNASGWSVTFPADTAAQEAAPCTP